jgi:hypothetical protein
MQCCQKQRLMDALMWSSVQLDPILMPAIRLRPIANTFLNSYRNAAFHYDCKPSHRIDPSCSVKQELTTEDVLGFPDLKSHPDNHDMQKKPLQTLDRIEYRPTPSSELSLIYRQTVTTFLERRFLRLVHSQVEPGRTDLVHYHFQIGRGHIRRLRDSAGKDSSKGVIPLRALGARISRTSLPASQSGAATLAR